MRSEVAYNQTAPKRAVNMTLNADLVRRVRAITPNLSETVETLLAVYVADAELRNKDREQKINAHVAASDAFVAKYGTLADEFGTL
jgi:antitoxin CcdA